MTLTPRQHEVSAMYDAEIFAPTYETVRYELERFGGSVMWAPEVLRAMRTGMHRDMARDQYVQTITGVVAMWREQRILRVPANWWQHFKQRWFPTWALKRWPVLEIAYDAAVYLPRVPVMKPEYHTLEFHAWRGSDQ